MRVGKDDLFYIGDAVMAWEALQLINNHYPTKYCGFTEVQDLLVEYLDEVGEDAYDWDTYDDSFMYMFHKWILINKYTEEERGNYFE